MKRILVITLALLFSIGLIAANKYETATLKSSVICGMCKDAIESGLSDIEGIRASIVFVSKNEVRVKYNPQIVSLIQIKQAISKIGYKADDVNADAKAFEALPACCKDASLCGEKQ